MRQAKRGLWQHGEIEAALTRFASYDPATVSGHLQSCTNAQAEVAGLNGLAKIGDGCWFERDGPDVLGEVVALHENYATVATLEELTSVTQGSRVRLDPRAHLVFPAGSWRGRVVNAMAQAIDDKGALGQGNRAYPLYAAPPPAHSRGRLGPVLPLGVRALDLFTPCCEGQRLGIFAGSGVGKSSMLSMIAANSQADVIVVGLIGERGRELKDFLEETLGPQGLRRSVVIAATSDAPAMMRRRAAYLTLTTAEYFRDQGLKVLCLLDSITRFAMALREIYLAAGQPPTTKGYPPAVFAELPKLLERAGPGSNAGSITGLFTVLVEGDDTNEPVSDTVRGILDGHVLMDRQLAERGHFPAVNVLKSISRSAPGCYLEQQRQVVVQAREYLQAYDNMAELIELGAYRHGSNPDLDMAIALQPRLAALLRQDLFEQQRGEDPFVQLADALTG